MILDDPFDLSVPPFPALYNEDAHPHFAEVAQSRGSVTSWGPIPDTPAGMRRPAAAGKSCVHLWGVA